MKQAVFLSLIIAIVGLTTLACGGAEEAPAASAPAPAAPTAAPCRACTSANYPSARSAGRTRSTTGRGDRFPADGP